MTKQKLVYDTFDVTIEGGADHEINDENIVIYNVPLTGEIVQEYHDGAALKSWDEVKKISTKNVPATFMHPEIEGIHMLVDEMSTVEKSEHVIGFLTKPSLDRKDVVKEKKLYSDIVIKRTDSTKHIESKLEAKEMVDVSIGFQFTKDSTPGELNGKSYDYVQRNIKLDHLAVLIDDEGTVHQGRAPAPTYGIGADKKDEDDKMSKGKDAFDTEINTFISQLITDNPALGKKDVIVLMRDKLWEMMEEFDGGQINMESKEDLLKAKDEAITAKDAAVKAKDEAVTAKDELQTEIDKKETELKEAKDKLEVYQEADKAIVDEKRTELKERYPGQDKIYDSADDEAITEAHKDMKDKKSQSLEGAGANAEDNKKKTFSMFGDDKKKTGEKE